MLDRKTIDDICNQYRAGITAQEITSRTKIGLPTIYKYLRREGIVLRGRGRKRKYRIVSPYMERMMAEEELGYDSLAYKLGVSTHHIWEVLTGRSIMTATLEYKITQAGWDGALARAEADAWHARNGGQK